jgi:excinuclease ABC subunit C
MRLSAFGCRLSAKLPKSLAESRLPSPCPRAYPYFLSANRRWTVAERRQPKDGSDVGALFSSVPFSGFGPNRLDPSPASNAVHQVDGGRPSVLRARLRQLCPKRPGVYGMIDARGTLIYLGKAKALRARLLSYFRARSRDPKAGRILRETRAITWEHAPSEFAALLRELELIRAWRPRFNVRGQPHRRRRAYICLGRQPAPYAFLAQRPPAGVLASFGPVPAGRRTREALRHCNDWFQLRDCPQSQTMHFADEGDLFPTLRTAGCLRHEIGMCLGPCAGACSRTRYHDHVRAARAFLCGASTVLQELERDMTAASTALAFERAAQLRDRLEAFRWLQEQLLRIRLARRRHSFIYPISDPHGNAVWYLIHRGGVERAIAAPVDAAARREAAQSVHDVYRTKQPRLEPAAVGEIEAVLLVAAWFRRHPEERAKCLRPGELLRRMKHY